MQRARRAGTMIGTASDQLVGADTAGELAKMASTDSELSRQIDAQLSGAKVTFDGATSTITPAPDALPASKPAPPRTSSSAPGSGGATVARASAGTGTRARAADPGRDHPARPRDPAPSPSPSPSPSPGTIPRPATARHRRQVSGTTFQRAAPFILILLVIVVGFDRETAIVGAVFGVGAGLVLLYVILRMTMRTGRKTTHMPKDDQFNRRS